MNYLGLLALLAWALPECATANRVVGMDIVRGRAEDLFPGSKPRLRRRVSAVQSDLENGGVGYFAIAEVGTPGQKIGLQIDTGSSDVWIPASDADLCLQDPDQCSLGAFDSSQSSSFSDVSQGTFEIAYMDGTGVEGDYITDVFALGSTSVSNLTMGLATNFTQGPGVMGIGYDTNEALAQETGGGTANVYPNLIDQLVTQGFIKTKAYSLWLNDLDANTGSVLFGGIDTEKYSGDLTELPISKDASENEFLDFTVTLSSLNMSTASGDSIKATTSTFAIPVILDCGTSLTYLPTSVTKGIFSAVGATYVKEEQAYMVPCSVATKNPGTTFDYGFGGDTSAVVKVPIDELVLPSDSKFRNGEAACTFGIQPNAAESDPSLLGDTFLRSAYVVYNLDTNAIYIGQTNFNATKTNIKEITAGTSGVPDVSGVATQVTAQQTFSGIPGHNLASGSAATISGSSSAASRVGPGEKAWMTVLPMGAALMLLGGTWFAMA